MSLLYNHLLVLASLPALLGWLLFYSEVHVANAFNSSKTSTIFTTSTLVNNDYIKPDPQFLSSVKLQVQSNLVIRNFLVTIKLFLNAKCSLILILMK
jgi:hypothetical protein